MAPRTNFDASSSPFGRSTALIAVSRVFRSQRQNRTSSGSDAAQHGRRVARVDGLGHAVRHQRADLLDDARQIIRREVILRLLDREDRECRDHEVFRVEPLDIACHRVALEIEHRRSEREIEERLLPVAERFKAALDAGRALLERDADVPHHLVESTAD
jgi:hypothetical protein